MDYPYESWKSTWIASELTLLIIVFFNQACILVKEGCQLKLRWFEVDGLLGLPTFINKLAFLLFHSQEKSMYS